MKRTLTRTIIVLFIFSSLFPIFAEEGMYPLSELHKLDLKQKGLEIEVLDLYDPNGTSLIDGIINLSGCTASFISKDGLILTNYHCAFGAIQRITTKENDYMKHGFMAEDRSKEVEAKGYTVRTIDFYKDVSKDVLKVVKKKMSYAERAKAIEKKIKKIVVKTEKKYPGKRAEVAEMFKGKTYVLFVYTYLKDIRLVYAPPRSIGEFGGEEDNWVWPRHTGDFTILRAYMSPDGKSADYSPDNVPYHPKKYLPVAKEGVSEGDFVFILGYPGRTYRHRTSHFLAFEEQLRMPFIVDLYGWVIKTLEHMSEKDRETTIKLAPMLKGLWNTMKNYMGKLQGMERLGLTEKRREEERKLQDFIATDKALNAKYGNVLNDIKKVYGEHKADAKYEYLLRYLNRFVSRLNVAYSAYEASIELKKPDTERKRSYMKRNFSRTLKWIERGFRNYYEPADKAVFKELLTRIVNLEGDKRVALFDKMFKKEGGDVAAAIDAYIQDAYAKTVMTDKKIAMGLFKKTTKELKQLDDPFMKLAIALYPLHQDIKAAQDAREGQLDKLSAQLIDVKKQFMGSEFIPDANSTLRLTYGLVEGYYPADAVYNSPLTTMKGIVEKHNTGKPYYQAPEKLLKLYKDKQFGSFKDEKLDDVPVAMLYSADTTGGNSGSPVLNAKGQLVGLNFDRAYEATINDYAWSQDYSRSIGVEIRYILWFLQKYSGADHILKEMGVID